MDIDFDAAKSARNLAERGLAFERAAEFDFETAAFSVDTRRDYGEIRHRALGLLDGRVHALVFVETEKGIRVISFRKANPREVRRYEQAPHA
ncbi:MAG: BrnT family toxin [Roseateles sp.]|uniref:BrnT family toxin n=1 Tax=Roseateles sp. TaxID=1971397 RepID=UPI0039E86B9B